MPYAFPGVTQIGNHNAFSITNTTKVTKQTTRQTQLPCTEVP